MVRSTRDVGVSSLLRRERSRRAAVRLSGGLAASLAAATTLHPVVAAQDATPGVAPVENDGDELVIGGLFSLTGEWSTLGVASKAALELAGEHINAELTAVGSPLRVRVMIEDTQLQPDIAMDATQSLVNQGAEVLIGPQSSAEVAALKEFVDTNGILLISQGSTASTLAFRDDNIFRVVPADVAEVEALLALMAQNGTEVVVPIWRNDDGNASLHNSMARLFPEHGGTVLDGVEYDAGSEDFTEALAALSDQVEQALDQHDAASVAVFLATFDDVTPILEAAAQVPNLAMVRWYGTDGSALIGSLPTSEAAAEFAVQVDYVAPLLGLSEETRSRWQPIYDHIMAETGEAPDAFSLAAYDAAWIATLAYLETGGSGDVVGYRVALDRTADRYYGVTGLMTLNIAGDRSAGDFDFWVIRQVDGGYAWVRAARYSADSGDVIPEAIGAEDGAPAAATPAG